jgi:hypothetical protein
VNAYLLEVVKEITFKRKKCTGIIIYNGLGNANVFPSSLRLASINTFQALTPDSIITFLNE